MLLMLLTLISGCFLGSPFMTIVFENGTNETLEIYIDDYKIGTVSPESQITYDRASWDSGEYPITAVNLQGDIIYQKTLTRNTMEKVETLIYKVVITSENKN